MTMAIKLKLCPFCGSAAVMLERAAKEGYKACCGDLTCIGSYIFKWHQTKEEAAAAWNRRDGNEKMDD